MPPQVLFMILFIGGLILIFGVIRPFMKGYREGMSEEAKNNHTGIKTYRTGKQIGFKNIALAIAILIGIIWVYSSNTNDINSNQHTVHNSDGSTYTRTNPNSTTDDNIGKNRSDIFWGVLVVVGVGIIVYMRINNRD